MTENQPVLCYVEDGVAYFTTQPLDKQWGDSWGAGSYEHNASTPYKYLERSEHDRKRGEWEIIEVTYEGAFRTPSHHCTNSDRPVRMMNEGGFPWLRGPTKELMAGATIDEFRQFVMDQGGVAGARSFAVIRQRIAEIESDDRFPHKIKQVARVQSNAPLALIQTEGQATVDALKWVLGEHPSCAGSWPSEIKRKLTVKTDQEPLPPMIDRFDPDSVPGGFGDADAPCMEKCKDGDYVRYEDWLTMTSALIRGDYDPVREGDKAVFHTHMRQIQDLERGDIIMAIEGMVLVREIDKTPRPGEDMTINYFMRLSRICDQRNYSGCWNVETLVPVVTPESEAFRIEPSKGDYDPVREGYLDGEGVPLG